MLAYLNSQLTSRWFFWTPFHLLGFIATAILVLQYGFGWSAESHGAMVVLQQGFLYGFVAFNIIVAAFVIPKFFLCEADSWITCCAPCLYGPRLRHQRESPCQAYCWQRRCTPPSWSCTH